MNVWQRIDESLFSPPHTFPSILSVVAPFLYLPAEFEQGEDGDEESLPNSQSVQEPRART